MEVSKITMKEIEEGIKNKKIQERLLKRTFLTNNEMLMVRETLKLEGKELLKSDLVDDGVKIYIRDIA